MKLNAIDLKRMVIAGLFLFGLSFCAIAQSLSESQVLERSSPSVGVVLVGDGEGLVIKLAPAIAIKADGVLLVPYHVVKDAKEVQVRLKSGEIFDDVQLLGTDERRDVAAIKIQASDLSPALQTNNEDLKIGDSSFVVTQVAGKLWSINGAKLLGIKLADEVPGAGEGFRVIQFDGQLASGIDGGVIVDSRGNPVGLVTKEVISVQKSGYAVPINSVKNLGEAGRSRSFNSGSSLKLPVSEAALRAAKLPDDPLNLLHKSRTVFVETNTTFFKEQQLINELNKRKEVKEWGWVLMTGSWDSRNKADLIIELDHQILSFDFTFTVRHRKSSVLISAGKAVIADGASGAPIMVDNIIKSISMILNPPPPKGK